MFLLSKGSNNIFLPNWVIKPLTLKITNASIKSEKEKDKIEVKDKAIKLKFSSESPWHGWITSALGELMSKFYPWIIKKDNFNSRALNLPLAVEFMHSIIMFRNIQLICTSQKPFKGEKKNLDLIFIFLLAKFAWEFCKVEIHNQNNFCVQWHIDYIWRLTGN